MALTKCHECSGTISSSAKACPHCGAGVKKSSLLGKLLLGLLAFVVLSSVISAFTEKPTAASAPAAKPALADKSEAMQAKRWALIEELVEAGAFGNVESSNGVARAWVTPLFQQLDYATKQSYIGVIYAYYFDGSSSSNFVRVIDNQTGKTIGSFNPLSGGLKYD